MGKTPKKPAPGGDESNLYIRRLKATTSASLKPSDTNLTSKQRESENPNRGKTIGVPKRLPVPTGKVLKSKLRLPATTESLKALKNLPRFQPSTSKDEKKNQSSGSTTSKDVEIIEMPTLHNPDSADGAVQALKVSITKKDVKEIVRVIVGDENVAKEETVEIQGHTNGKETIDLTETENTTPRADPEKEENSADKNSAEKSQQVAEEKTVDSRNENDSSEITKNNLKHDDSKTEHPSTEFEDNALKLEDEEESPKPSEQNGDSQDIARNCQNEKDSTELKETIVEVESKKSTETCSSDVVESTTSESQDSGHGTQTEKDLERDANQTKDNPQNDASFVSYDASIMLKDVQIKLNDCLKDNSKLFDVSAVNDENGDINAEDKKKQLDMSFGKTLRNISGRNTINRLKYVTVREHRFSPNSSLFVNTSSASIDPDDSTSYKFLRNPTDLSDSILTNGNPADRKRKIITETADESAKKLKTGQSERKSLLNTSFEILKGLRRPIQVSTPNAKTDYKYSTDKYSAESLNDDTSTIDADVEPKKWCIVM